MKKNLFALQEEMKQRQPDQLYKNFVASQPTASDLCVNCHRRVKRKGKDFCSRCTYKGVENTLRDTLPGTVVSPSPTPSLKAHHDWKTTRSHNSTYMYTGVQEGMRTATEIPTESHTGPQPVHMDPHPAAPEDDEESPIKKAIEYELDNEGDGEIDVAPGSTYNRKQVSRLTGASSSTISRYEQRGLFANCSTQPKKLVHNGQLVYTQEHVEAIKTYRSQETVPVYSPRAPRQRNPAHEVQPTEDTGRFNLSVNAVNKLGQGTKANKRLNRVVASRAGSLIR